MTGSSETLIVSVVACVAVVALVINSATRRRLLHQERMSAIEKGVPPPEEAQAEDDPESRLRWASRSAALNGTIWISLGLGMLTASKLVHNPDLTIGVRQLLASFEVAAYPAMFAGAGLLIFGLVSRPRKR